MSVLQKDFMLWCRRFHIADSGSADEKGNTRLSRVSNLVSPIVPPVPV